jgi:HEAT repeat protein
MVENFFHDQKWEDVLERLKNRQIPPERIGSAIVRLGKPFDRARILAAKEAVAPYLDHSDSWVRHEAMWFLTAWGGLKEYEPALIRALRTDPDLDNRSFAATCLGRLQEGTADADAVAALKTAVEDETLDRLVRLYAYGALLQVVRGISDLAYLPHEHKLSEIDWEWISSLSQTTS